MKRIHRYFLFIIICWGVVLISGCTQKVQTAGTITNFVKTKNIIAENDIPEPKVEEKVETETQTETTQEPTKDKPKNINSTTSNQTASTTKPNTATNSKYPYYIKVNRLANCVTIYSQDANGAYTVPVKAMVCSVGKNINKTPTGVFKTSDKYTWRYLFGDQYGQYATRITGHILFHSVPYTSQSKNTLKTDYYNNLGVGDSMGCIRLTCADAKWIYDNCAKGTTVEIYDSSDPGPLGKPTAMQIDVNSPYAMWDPTDPDAANPWKTAKPTISGVANMSVTLGEVVDYLSNISAIDAYGVILNVNTSGNVDVSTCGEYVITYTTTDARGNTTSATAVITVVEPIDSEENSGELSNENEYGQ